MPKSTKLLGTKYRFETYANLFPFFINGQKQQKSKAIPFTFRPFLADFSIFEKEAKNNKKVRL